MGRFGEVRVDAVSPQAHRRRVRVTAREMPFARIVRPLRFGLLWFFFNWMTFAAFDDSGAATWYKQQADAIDKRIPEFWSSSKGYLVATLNNARSGQDCGTLLGSLHGTGKRGFGKYTPGSDEVLVTLQALVDSMKPIYPINSQSGYPGVAVGRYPSDVYDVSLLSSHSQESNTNLFTG